MNNDNQWELDGNCSLCRRKKYCSKPCKRYKSSLRRLISSAMDEATGGNYSNIMSMFEYGKHL